MSNPTVWTIGHSTRSADEFLGLLSMHGIKCLIDIRAFPGSRRYPHFNKEHLSVFLEENGIGYRHMVGLGGRRRPLKNSPNIAWRNASFRGYADYMQTDEFKKEVALLEDLSRKTHTAYMCSEATWWRCHRALVSDYLKAKGWEVLHIMEHGKLTPHPYTSPARAVQGTLFYDRAPTDE